MNGSLDQAQPAQFSVIVDGRLDKARAYQVVMLAGRLGLARAWLRRPWWPDTGMATGMADAEADDLLARVRGDGPIPLGVIDRVAGPAGEDAVFVRCHPGRDLSAEVAAAAAATARGRPVLVEVTVSVGRTEAEARARADADDLFRLIGHPARQGLFGTLEECQVAAARLRHAGATELVCYLPLAADLPDVLAQVRSIAIGAAVLRPGDPPSAAPPPPAGWGGRH